MYCGRLKRRSADADLQIGRLTLKCRGLSCRDGQRLAALIAAGLADGAAVAPAAIERVRRDGSAAARSEPPWMSLAAQIVADDARGKLA